MLQASGFEIHDLGVDVPPSRFADEAGKLKPDTVVMVVSVKALKRHGDGNVKKGLVNLEKHLENISFFKVPVIVAINHFIDDKDDEIKIIEDFCNSKNVPVALADIWSHGGEGGIELAGKLVSLIHNNPSNFKFLYDINIPITDKIEIIAKTMYGASRVVYTITAERDLKLAEQLELDNLPICIAKTQYSLSDDSKSKYKISY